MAAMAMFGKMDTDKDGFLTKSEIQAGHEKYMRKPAKHSSGGGPPELTSPLGAHFYVSHIESVETAPRRTAGA